MMPDEIKIGVESWGPTAAQVAEATRAVMGHPQMGRFIANSRTQILSSTLVDHAEKGAEPVPPNRLRTTVYDYTHNRTLVVNSLIGDSTAGLEINEFGSHELPAAEEFEAAVRVLESDHSLGPLLREKKLRPYRPMPPLVNVELPDGRVERIVAVGLNGTKPRHRIVGVNLNRGGVITNVPDAPAANDGNCGPPADDSCGVAGNAQKANVKIVSGGATLWEFQVTRPFASSGTNGSGIEFQHVRYKGKQVLYQAHVPILNIQYLNATGGCGPTYRDWQNSENCFQAVGNDPLPGFRLCTSPAKTIFDSGSDSGNFRGVAIYVDGPEVVFVSELEAGWYRYIPIWRFNVNGTIRPRWAFGAIDNGCTCKTHHHHVYWRLDFDIETAANNLVEEFNDPILVGSSNWHKKVYEIRRPKDAGHKRKWKISNTVTGSAYELVPGQDGNSDAYGIGDLWVLRYHPNEIDDGQGFTTNAALSQEHIDNFKSPAELVENQDVVIWYAAHFLHDESHAGGPPHIVGPDIRPVKW
jgi:hypothetical protein